MYLSLDSLGNKAKPYVEKAGKMLNLISYLQPYLHKDGLNDAKSDLKLLMDYVTDIAHGNYSNYRTDRLLPSWQQLAKSALVFSQPFT